jgi:hypothetical protein
MRELLLTMPEGPPADYLVARIRGRRALLVPDWEILLLAPEPLGALPAAPWRPGANDVGKDNAWQALQREYCRVFAMMEERLRRLFVPFFWLAELRTVTIMLRNRTGDREPDGELLRHSLLADGLKEALCNHSGVAASVEALSKLLKGVNVNFSRLPQIFTNGGLKALEEELSAISLEWFAGTANNPHIARLMALLIDGRNLSSLAKQLHWRMETPPRLLAGGSISLMALKSMFHAADADGVARLAARLGRDCSKSTPGAVQNEVLGGQGKTLRRIGRDPDGIGTILDYLWRCGMETRNLGLLGRLATAGIDSVAPELLR